MNYTKGQIIYHKLSAEKMLVVECTSSCVLVRRVQWNSISVEYVKETFYLYEVQARDPNISGIEAVAPEEKQSSSRQINLGENG